MNTVISINGGPPAGPSFLTWTPSKAEIKLQNPGAETGPIQVKLRNKNANGGQAVFYAASSGAGTNELMLNLPVNGNPVTFFVGGKFGSPSKNGIDNSIEVVRVAPGALLSTIPIMVRVRKNANQLTANERDRFIAAMAQLNDQGTGPFKPFAEMHDGVSDTQIHGNSSFLPWHRAYLLDLERELQKINQTVTLPYWKFDEAAPNLFSRAFIGIPNAQDVVQFTLNNPLRYWKGTDQVPGILRRPRFNTSTSGASNSAGPVNTELATLNMGGANNQFQLFRQMEGNPHGRAHTSFLGDLSDTATAPRDPLFFLLHTNVDRLWAKWQWARNRFDGAQASSYSTNGSPVPSLNGIKLNDTMWPWDGIKGGTRPPTAPGGTFPPSPILSVPGLKPRVSQTIDFHGVKTLGNDLGFGYDDIPFEF